ncbi:MAG: M48 family metalloprotease [Thermoplasmata archaeon]
MVGPVVKTAGLFAVIIALFVVVGGILGQIVFGSLLAGLAIALGLALVMNLVSYFLCVRFVLWSSRARIVTAAEAPRLAKIVSELAPTFGLVAPRIALISTMTPNAFATGRDERHAVVAATEGILHLLNDRQLTGVLAHELAHIKDRDILVMTLAATLAGAISYLAQAFIFGEIFGGFGGSGRASGNNLILAIVAVIAAPVAAGMIQLAISRSRELRADEVGARTIEDPEALAGALEQLESANDRRPQPIGTPATSALCIVNPLRGKGAFKSMFSTHPPLEERIRRLRAMKADYTYRVRPSGRRNFGSVPTAPAVVR